MAGSIEWEDSGRLFFKTAGSDGKPVRRPIEPGDMGGGHEGGVYQETDLSTEHPVLQAVAPLIWTEAIKAAWKVAAEARHAELVAERETQKRAAAEGETQKRAAAEGETAAEATRQRRAKESAA